MRIICSCGCGVSFDRKPSQVKRSKFNYYSQQCRDRHYKIIRKGSANFKWKGGRLLRKDGYIEVCKPDHPNANKKGYILEHRLIVEEKLGRFLNKDEIVHHKNRNRSDNRIENLIILSQSNHLKEHISEMMLNRERNSKGQWLPKQT